MALVSIAGCDEHSDHPGQTSAPAASQTSAGPAASASGQTSAGPAASASSQTSAPAASVGHCPEGMAWIAGGPFHMGSDSPQAAPEDRPRFETEVAGFCMDITEVTVDAYAACVKSGKCEAGENDRRFCNVRYPDRGDHPINCVTWYQSKAYCEAQGKRLPLESEWEFAARGGSEYRTYSWGNESPDGRTCWKHVGGSCKVRSYDPGAFGLYDMTGNVWEWVDDWFGELPWPPEHSQVKSYRGGSWSRRFEKWMSTRLRNRYGPKKWGSHLGFRCALTPKDVKCPFGRTEDQSRCQFGVKSMGCPAQESWNGVRCAREGEPECPEGRVKKPGHGCSFKEPVGGPAPEVESTPVTRSRSPEFDADCLQNKPGRPHSYRYVGGTHAKRNHVSAQAGCSNRDVGVGWNSTCCP